MTRKANRSTRHWTRRYLVLPRGTVFLIRGRGKKQHGKVMYQTRTFDNRWVWVTPPYGARLVDTDAQLVALRLQGIPVQGAPRWKDYSA